jgi:hypothetical protein
MREANERALLQLTDSLAGHVQPGPDRPAGPQRRVPRRSPVVAAAANNRIVVVTLAFPEMTNSRAT